jgi:post-segregation antitoxin (ccd killing protein)
MAQTQAMTVSVDATTLADAKRLAGPRGLSALVNAAMQAEVRRRRVVALLQEWEGSEPSTAADIAAARSSLAEILGEQAVPRGSDPPGLRRRTVS